MAKEKISQNPCFQTEQNSDTEISFATPETLCYLLEFKEKYLKPCQKAKMAEI
jgi:hypothetical protein